jgi:hypothetical protein
LEKRRAHDVEAALRRRSQFAPEPARCFPRFHRIDKIDHALMNVIARGTFRMFGYQSRTGQV